MRAGNIFVAGQVERKNMNACCSQYEVSALMSPYRARFFGRVDRFPALSALPKACFDLSFGKLALEDGDLALDPRLCDAKAALRVAQWYCELSQGAAAC